MSDERGEGKWNPHDGAARSEVGGKGKARMDHRGRRRRVFCFAGVCANAAISPMGTADHHFTHVPAIHGQRSHRGLNILGITTIGTAIAPLL